MIFEDYLDDNYVPKPIIFLDYNSETESFIIKTQSFILDKALNMYCYYTDDSSNDDFTTWNKMELDFTKDDYFEYTDSGLKKVKDTFDLTTFKQAFYYFEIPLSTAVDKDYKIMFYNFWSNKGSEVVTYEFKYNSALDYVQDELQVKLGLGTKINTAFRFFKDRFGFLYTPIDFIINILTRISNIQYKEPIIHFPRLVIPDTDYVICEGFEYNFNDTLEIPVINTLHEYLLIGVDFFFATTLLGLSYKTLKEVLHK